MPGLLKRFRPKEVDPTDRPGPSQQSSAPPVLPLDKAEKDIALSSARDIEEADANQRLSTFERAHRWDPNLDDEQLRDIDDAVNARDPSSEARIFDGVFENSPYPEVCRTSLFPSYGGHILACDGFVSVLQLLIVLRYVQLSGTMTKNSHAIPLELG